jgi:hypothetical protein
MARIALAEPVQRFWILSPNRGRERLSRTVPRPLEGPRRTPKMSLVGREKVAVGKTVLARPAALE